MLYDGGPAASGLAREKFNESSVSKTKNEPRKSNGAEADKKAKPRDGAVTKAAHKADEHKKPDKKAGASDKVGAEKRPDKKAADKPEAAQKPEKKAADKKPAAEKRARGAERARAADHGIDHDHDGDHEHEHHDDHEHEHHDDAEGGGERDDFEPDQEVVEVVGEIIDEPTIEGDEAIGATSPSTLPDPDHASVALSRTDPLQAYLREVQRHPLLTSDEEKKLTEKYATTQDVRTAARLVTANLRLVVKLAYEYRRAYKNIMDLIQEGNIGLMQAVKRYDPYRGVKLSSYAAWWIRAYILRFILNNWRLVKLGTTQAQRKLFFNLNKEKSKLAAMGIEPTASEIANRLAVDEKDVVEMDHRLASGEASLDAPAGDAEGRAVSRVELMPTAWTGPEVQFEAHEMGQLVHDRLQKFRRTLKGKDVIIFDKRVTADEPLTLQELGDEFGVSRERVRQLEARLTLRLREFLREELGDAVGAGG